MGREEGVNNESDCRNNTTKFVWGRPRIESIAEGNLKKGTVESHCPKNTANEE